jgi:hypothetical protein
MPEHPVRCQVENQHLSHLWLNYDESDTEPLECPGDAVRDQPSASRSEIELALATLDRAAMSQRAFDHVAESLVAIHEDGQRRWYTVFEVKQLFHQNRKDRLSCSWGGFAYDGPMLYQRPVGMALQLTWPKVGDSITFVDNGCEETRIGVVTWSGWGYGPHVVRVRGQRGLVPANHIMGRRLDAAAIAARMEALRQQRQLRNAETALRSEQHRVAGNERARLLEALPEWLRKGQPITWTDRDSLVCHGVVHESRRQLRELLDVPRGRHHALIRKVHVSYRLDVTLTVEERLPSRRVPAHGRSTGQDPLGTDTCDISWDVDLNEMGEIVPLPRSKAEAQRWLTTPPSAMPKALPSLPAGYWGD